MADLINHPWVFGILTLLILSAALELGLRVAQATSLHADQNRKDQMNTIRDGMFVLTSLLLGFSLTLSVARFAERRSLLVEEAAAVHAAFLGTEMLPQPYRLTSQDLLRRYIETRFDIADDGEDPSRFEEAIVRSGRLQHDLWDQAAAAAQTDRSAALVSYVNALTRMIDLHEKRVASFETRVPWPVWILIVSVSLIAVFTRGMTLTSRFWMTLVLVPVTIAIVVALIADLDSPGSGLIRLDQRAMERLRAELAPGAHY